MSFGIAVSKVTEQVKGKQLRLLQCYLSICLERMDDRLYFFAQFVVLSRHFPGGTTMTLVKVNMCSTVFRISFCDKDCFEKSVVKTDFTFMPNQMCLISRLMGKGHEPHF